MVVARSTAEVSSAAEEEEQERGGTGMTLQEAAFAAAQLSVLHPSS